MSEEEHVKYTPGYHFARAYMLDATKWADIEFEPDDTYTEDVEDYYIPPILDAVKMFMEPQYAALKKYALRNAPRINSSSMFRNFCIICVCQKKFSTGYSHMNYLHSLSLISYMVFYLSENHFQDYFFDAMFIIGDILDFYLENGEFERDGGWDELCDIAESINIKAVKEYLSTLGK